MGCDLQRLANSSQFTGFNPRTRMRCDRIWRISRLKSSMFQSTHPHGVRPKPIFFAKFKFCFNPRTRMGCDYALSNHRHANVCFNPRTRMGCDTHIGRADEVFSVSIHAPAWGATCSNAMLTIRLSCFNPRTRMGCDPKHLCSTRGRRRFNPRTRMGCDKNDENT